MTKDEIMALDTADLEQRSLEIAEEAETADADGLDALSAELDYIEERKNAIKAEAAEKRAKMSAVLEGEGEVIEKQEERKKMSDNKEIRKSAEYLDAWVENLKGRASEEQRALLTENAKGTIAVPTYVDNIIHTAWENDDFMRRIRKTYFKGNLKVGYEMSASGAVVHPEGGEEIAEENLVIGFVELIGQTYKKMVRYSTEVLDMKGEAFVDYIVDEIEYQIVKAVRDGALNSMIGNDLVVELPVLDGHLSTVDIINAQGRLSGEAEAPVIITTRSNASDLKIGAMNASHAYDPFDGLEVVYADNMPANVEAVVADLSGVQANFPDGDDVKFVFDEYTEAPADIVRVIGRMMVGVGVVAPGKVVVIKGVTFGGEA